MRKMKKIFCFLLVFALMFGCFSNTAFALTMGTKPSDNITYGQPFDMGTAGSEKFRIPCLVALDDGTIVAGCDARWTTYMDGGGLDTIVSYSKDKGKTWHYTLTNYLGDNGNIWNTASTAFIDPAMASDGENVWLIADLYPAGIALNGGTHGPITGHTGYDANGNLALKKGCEADTNGDGRVDTDVNGDGSLNASDYAANVEYSYSLVKKANATNEDYYEIKAENGNGAAEEGYTIDAWFNITGTDVDTNLFCSDSPYHPYPTDFLYKTKSEDGGQTWSIPSLIDVKKAAEQTLLIGPGRGMVTSEGRIVFTAYEFTGGDKNSCCIYSDDGGETWTRGASVSGWSSEAVVTEADGKLYMFTRHGNAYYVSEDWGETWGPQKSTGLSYNNNCQLTAITYSEKIDGKTAIIFAAPSDTGTRAAGKLFIGLVQDDGSLNWKYTYSINGSAFYAYSCLAELNDGTVGLLYESDSSEITYINIPIEEIVPDAVIGNIYFTDSEDNITASHAMSSNKTASFTIHGLAEGATVSAVSSNEEVLTAAINGMTLTITSKTVANLEQVNVKVVSGDEETVMKVNITDAEQYEILELHPGESKTFVDTTGNYANTDVSSVNKDVAKVTLTGNSPQTRVQMKAQLATAAGTANFNGDIVDISKCLYTFNGSNGSYTITSTTADGTQVYLNLREASSGTYKFASVNSTTFTVEKHGSNETFRLQDMATSGGGSGHLYFHDNNTSKLYFDRNGSTDANRCYFELYTPSTDAPADSVISGYEKVTSLDEVQNGGKYLIVTKEANDGERYVLYPSLETANYKNVARVTREEEVVKKVPAAQLATATANFTGDIVDISNCLYTFTSTGTANQYNVSGRDENGNTVYLYYRKSSSGSITGNVNSAPITFAKHASEAKFSIQDNSTGSNNGAYLYFHEHETNKLYFNRNGSIDANHCYFELYTPSANAPADSLISGYKKVTNLDEIKNGGRYLIVTKEAGDGNRYVMVPSLGTNVHNHVAKITEVEKVVEPELAVRLASSTAVFDGETKRISECLYTFISTGTENQYNVSGTDANGNPVYLYYRKSSSGSITGNASSAPITFAKHASEAKFSIQDNSTGSNNGTYLYFHEHETNKLYFNRNGSIDANHCYFELYTPSADAPADSLISGYKKVTGLDEIKNGGRYLIVTKEAGNGSRYLMVPSLGTNAHNHVAQITDELYVDKNRQAITEIVIEAIGEGSTFVKIGDITYYVIVENDIENTEETIDKTELRKLHNANSYKEQGNYTYSSWETFATALANAGDVLRSKEATQEDVTSAKAALEAANNGLVDQSELLKLYNANSSKEQGAYLDKYWVVFTEALANAEGVLNKDDATRAEIDSAKAALEAAIEGLCEKGQEVIPVEYMEASVGNANPVTGNDGGADFAVDGNPNTMWHTTYDGTPNYDDHWFMFKLKDGYNYKIYSLKYLPRQGSSLNGLITKYIVEVSNDGETWTTVGEGDWTYASRDWKVVEFEEPMSVKYVRLQSEASLGDSSNKIFTTAAEVRLTGVLPANYAAVDAAIAEAEAIDRSLYTEGSLAVVDEAVAAVDRNKDSYDQAEVDAMAKAITDAINALVEKEPEQEKANYEALNAAIAEAEALNKDNYVDFTGVEEALAAAKALSKDLNKEDQAQVDAAAKELNDAIDALVEKEPEQEKANYEALNVAIAEAEALNKDNYVDFTGVEEALAAAKALSKDLNKEDQAQVDAAANALNEAVNALELKPANYEAVDAAKAAANEIDRSLYTDESLAALDTAVGAVVEGLKITDQTQVDAYAGAIESAILRLAYKDANYTVVNNAKAKIPGDLSIYTAETVKALEDAVAAVEEGKNITEQETVNGYAAAIEAAINALEVKPADYSEVDEVITEANALVKDNYVDFAAVEAAVAAVVRDKDITAQEEVNAMAQAIREAIAALELKLANYEAVEAAKAKVPADLSKYTDETVEALNAALAAVTEGLDITKQSEVDEMANGIEKALAALKEKEVDKPSSGDSGSSGSSSSGGSGSSGSSSSGDSGSSGGSGSTSGSGSTQQPSTDKKPVTQQPVTQKPVTQQPATQKPATQKPAETKPQPTPEAPSTEKPEISVEDVVVDTKIVEETASEGVKAVVKETVVVTEEKAAVTTETVEKVIENTQKGATIILPLTEAAEGQKVKEAEVPVKALEKIAEAESALTVEFEGAKVTFEAETIKAIAEQAKGSTVEVRIVPVEDYELNEEQQAVLEKHDVAVRVSAQIFSDGEYIGNFNGGKARIAIPFNPGHGKKAEDHKVYYVADNGDMTLVPSVYADKHMIIETDHFSEYVIVYEGETEVEEESVVTENVIEDVTEDVTSETPTQEIQEEKAGLPVLPIIIGIVVVLAVAAVTVMTMNKKDGEN